MMRVLGAVLLECGGLLLLVVRDVVPCARHAGQRPRAAARARTHTHTPGAGGGGRALSRGRGLRTAERDVLHEVAHGADGHHKARDRLREEPRLDVGLGHVLPEGDDVRLVERRRQERLERYRQRGRAVILYSLKEAPPCARAVAGPSRSPLKPIREEFGNAVTRQQSRSS